MTLNQSALLELTDVLRTADGGQVMRLMLSAMLQALVDAEATAYIGANPYEHTPTRTTQRNGTREKTVSTTAGDLMVKIPKLRAGSFFPSLLAPRRRIDVALYAVVMEAYVHGVSTRKVDDLVAALGVDAGISKSEVSRICADLDVEVAVFQGRGLTEQAFPYVFVDATYCKARVAGRVVSQAVVIATGVSADGRREVLGSAVGDSETQDFWTEFLRGLRERGLHGVQLVISDHHRGLMAEVQGAFHEERVGQGPQGQHRDGRCRDPHGLRPTHRPPGPGPGRDRRDHARTQAPRRGRHAAPRPGRDHRVRRLPRSALAQGVVFFLVVAPPPRGQEAHRRRRNLPQSRCPAPAFVLCPDRGTRRMASQRTPLPVRNLHGHAHPIRANRPDTTTRPDGGDRHHPGPHGIVHNTKHHA